MFTIFEWVLHSLFAYVEERLENDLPVDGERLNGFVCLVQSLLLGFFAAILASHRSEILDQKISVEDDDGITYEAPKRTTVVWGSSHHWYYMSINYWGREKVNAIQYAKNIRECGKWLHTSWQRWVNYFHKDYCFSLECIVCLLWGGVIRYLFVLRIYFPIMCIH